jgi:hypothetical protein
MQLDIEMIPLPLLIVVCIIGIVTAAIVIETVVSVVRSIVSRRAKPTSPLSACEMTSSTR